FERGENSRGEVGRLLAPQDFFQADVENWIEHGISAIAAHRKVLSIQVRKCCLARCIRFFAPSSLIPNAAAMPARDCCSRNLSSKACRARPANVSRHFCKAASN